MALAVTSGTQAATLTTEHTLVSSDTTFATIILAVDTSAMVYGDASNAHDELELRIKMKVLTGGSELLVFLATYVGAQTEPVKVSIPVTSPYSYSVTLKQTTGAAGRSFPWHVVEIT